MTARRPGGSVGPIHSRPLVTIMSAGSLLLLVASSLVFIAAGSGARWYIETPRPAVLVGVLVLYTIGNLLIIRLMRETGLALAVSISAVAQLVAINLVAILVFRETLGPAQYAGLGLGIVSIALFALFPARS